MWTAGDRFFYPQMDNGTYIVSVDEFKFLKSQYEVIEKGWAFKFSPSDLIERTKAKSDCNKLVEFLNNKLWK